MNYCYIVALNIHFYAITVKSDTKKIKHKKTKPVCGFGVSD